MKRIWYHCSQIYNGNEFTVINKVPFRSEKEPLVPRLCVCPTIALCFTARLFKYDQAVFVYKSAKKYNGIKPYNVWDQPITRERWLIYPCRMIFEKQIPAETVRKCCLELAYYHRDGKKNSSFKIRLMTWHHVSQYIGTDWDKRKSEFYLKMFNYQTLLEFLDA
jgi:hypothetical protein